MRLGVGEIMNRLLLELFHLDIESWSGPRSKFVTFGGGGREEGRDGVGWSSNWLMMKRKMGVCEKCLHEEIEEEEKEKNARKKKSLFLSMSVEDASCFSSIPYHA